MSTRAKSAVKRKSATPYRGSSSDQGYGTQWRRTRIAILLRDPICVLCNQRSSVDVDHITARKKGGSDHPDNLRGLCRPCHSRKTVREDGGFKR